MSKKSDLTKSGKTKMTKFKKSNFVKVISFGADFFTSEAKEIFINL